MNTVSECLIYDTTKWEKHGEKVFKPNAKISKDWLEPVKKLRNLEIY